MFILRIRIELFLCYKYIHRIFIRTFDVKTLSHWLDIFLFFDFCQQKISFIFFNFKFGHIHIFHSLKFNIRNSISLKIFLTDCAKRLQCFNSCFFLDIFFDYIFDVRICKSIFLFQLILNQFSTDNIGYHQHLFSFIFTNLVSLFNII